MLALLSQEALRSHADTKVLHFADARAVFRGFTDEARGADFEVGGLQGALNPGLQCYNAWPELSAGEGVAGVRGCAVATRDVDLHEAPAVRTRLPFMDSLLLMDMAGPSSAATLLLVRGCAASFVSSSVLRHLPYSFECGLRLQRRLAHLAGDFCCYHPTYMEEHGARKDQPYRITPRNETTFAIMQVNDLQGSGSRSSNVVIAEWQTQCVSLCVRVSNSRHLSVVLSAALSVCVGGSRHSRTCFLASRPI